MDVRKALLIIGAVGLMYCATPTITERIPHFSQDTRRIARTIKRETKSLTGIIARETERFSRILRQETNYLAETIGKPTKKESKRFTHKQNGNNYPNTFEGIEQLIKTSGYSYEQYAQHCANDLAYSKYLRQRIDSSTAGQMRGIAKHPALGRAIYLIYAARNGEKDTDVSSFHDIHDKKTSVCCYQALEINAMVLFKRYPANGIVMTQKGNDIGHAVFTYVENGKMGYSDNNTISQPIYRNAGEVVNAVNKYQGAKYTTFLQVNLDKDAKGWEHCAGALLGPERELSQLENRRK